ncbi:hypothetical protein QEN19_003165 [Hanseniaspora menglaensis]
MADLISTKTTSLTNRDLEEKSIRNGVNNYTQQLMAKEGNKNIKKDKDDDKEADNILPSLRNDSEVNFVSDFTQSNYNGIDDLQQLTEVMTRECLLYSSINMNSAFKSFNSETERDILFSQLVDISNNNSKKSEVNKNNNTLEKLFLSHNLLYKLPIQISLLKNLKVLDLKHNNFYEIPFKFLPVSLTILEISFNSLDRNVSLSTSRAQELVNLKYLNINDNKFTSVNQLANLLKLPNLKIVDVNNIADMDVIPVISKDFLTNLRSFINNSANNNNNTGTTNQHSRYNEYFKRLSVLTEDVNEENPNEVNSNNSAGNSKINSVSNSKTKTSLFKKPNPNVHYSSLSHEIGRSRTPTHMETSTNAMNNTSMFGAVTRSRTSSVSETSTSNSANIKKNIQTMNNPSENIGVLNIKKNTTKPRSRKSSFSNTNATSNNGQSNTNQFGYQRISSFSSEHKYHLFEDSSKIEKEKGKLEYNNIKTETLKQARKKSQIIKYDKLLICCRRLLFTFTESQQTLRRVTQFGKDKTVAMNVVQLLYSTSHAIDNLVEVLEKCEEEESLSGTNYNSKKILIKTCQDIFPFFKQIFKLLKTNFESFFQNVELCFLRMFYMNLMNSYTELYNAYMIIKHKSDHQSVENSKRGSSTSGHSIDEGQPVEAALHSNSEDTVIINQLTTSKPNTVAASSQNLETLSVTSSHSSNTQQAATSQPPVVTPTLISPMSAPIFQRSRSNTFTVATENMLSPNINSSVNTSASTNTSSINKTSGDIFQSQNMSDDQKLLKSLKFLHSMISQGIVDRIEQLITAQRFPGLSQQCINCKKIDAILSTELQTLDLENISVNKSRIWELMSQQIKAVLLFLSSVKQSLVDLTNVIDDEQNKDIFSQDLSSLARLTKEITMLLDKSSFKQQ